MPIPRLTPDHTALLVIDVQDRLLPTIIDADRVVANCATLLRMSTELNLPYLVTEQYPRGLGRTAQPILDAMPDQSRRVEKTIFSAAVDLVVQQLDGWGCRTVLICGMESHVCVLQTVLDLQAGGRQCFVCIDAVSGSQREQMQPAYARMRDAGAVITGVTSAVYEMMRDARHQAFKPVLELTKQLQF